MFFDGEVPYGYGQGYQTKDMPGPCPLPAWANRTLCNIFDMGRGSRVSLVSSFLTKEHSLPGQEGDLGQSLEQVGNINKTIKKSAISNVQLAEDIKYGPGREP